MHPTGAELGFFGKLPSAGDFVQRRLPPSFVNTWDPHFEHAMDASRQALGAAWQHAYRSSPVWRFLLSPGVCGPSAWVGVLGPAGDRVGRSFPMVITAPLAEPAAAPPILRDGAAWFAAVERVHLAAQADPSISVEAFDAQLLGLAQTPLAVPAASPNGVDKVVWQKASQWRVPLPCPRSDGVFLEQLWTHVSSSGNGWCLWWTQGGGHVPASVLVTRGLPEPTSYAGFLDAQQAGDAWQTLGSFEAAPHRHAQAPHVSLSAPLLAPPSRQLLPDDLGELFADLVPPVSMAVAAGSVEANIGAALGNQGAVTIYRSDIALAVVAADEGEPDTRRQAAAAAGQVASGLRAEDLAGDLKALSQRLLALHPGLRERSEDLINPVPEDGSVIAVHITRRWANLLRIGTAAAWLWRKGALQSLFATAATQDEGNALGGEFDDLLFTRAAPVASGLGGATEPLCDEVVCAVEEGDRLLLVTTQSLVQFAPDVYARALAMPTCEEARARIAAAAGLVGDATRWPLAVIEVTS